MQQDKSQQDKSQQDKTSSKWQLALEILSVVGPIICLVDCVVIPILLTVLPIIGVRQIFHGIGDQILLMLVLAICTPTITSGFLQHKRKSVIVLMSLGFASMFLANFAGHSIDEGLHWILTTLGSVFLIKANFDNRQFRKTPCCDDHCHPIAIKQEVGISHPDQLH